MAVTFYIARHGETQFNVQNRVQGWCDSPLTPSGIYDAYRLGQGLADVEFVGACTSDSGRAQHTLSIALEARENERMRLRRGLLVADEPVKADEAAELFEDEAADPTEQIAAIEELLRLRGCLEPHSPVPDTDENAEADCRRLTLAEDWRPSADELDWLSYPAYTLPALPLMPRIEASVPARCDVRLREWCFGDLEGEPALRLRNRMFDLFGDDLPREEQNDRLNEIADYLFRADETRRAENFATITRRLRSFIDDCGRSVEARGGGNVLVVSHALLIRSLVFTYAPERVSDPPKIKNASITKVRWDNGEVTVESVGETSHLAHRS